MTQAKTVGKFYIGREYNLKSSSLTDKDVLYDPEDLTTHAVVVGMTGSGKTGLCIDILEEAALNGIPALLIDPKGDIGNLLLHFPELQPAQFEPWVDADEARRENKTVSELATEQADLWKQGLGKWGIDEQRIRAVKDAVEYAIYTPGSDAGLPVSILASLKAPDVDWDENREILQERISSTVTALLGLVGIEADPMRTREHILLSNIFEQAWKQAESLELEELIRRVQTPPFEKLGAFDVEQFYPPKERFELAMILNNLLAAPSFSLWIEGEPLDIGAMLWTPEGKPRHSVFYLAHLSDSERMFFVTLLLSSIETWVRTQSGTSSLRALLYFDEVYGFLPPIAKPPSKPPLMRLLKQARAFGFGVILATQNPADLDYKALSNAGTWFVGRLQTERDKNRLLDGLEGISAGQAGFKRGQTDKMISSLGKRVFLLHNVHEKAPLIFHTRWAMAYLRGPVTRDQVRSLNTMVAAKVRSQAADPTDDGENGTAVAVAAGVNGELSNVRGMVPSSVEEVFLPNTVTLSQALKAAGKEDAAPSNDLLVYRPALLAQATARILDRKSGLDVEQPVAALIAEPDRRGLVRWEKHLCEAFQVDELARKPVSGASFSDLKEPLTNAKKVASMQKDFIDHVYRTSELRLPYSPVLDLLGEPAGSTAGFRKQCTEAARGERDLEIGKLRKKYEKRIHSIEKKLMREEQELEEDKAEHTARKVEEAATLAENVWGLLGGSRSRRRVSSSVTKRRMTTKAKADVKESLEMIEVYRKELAELQTEVKLVVEEIEAKWAEAATQIEEKVLTPFKKNIFIDLFGVAWAPYWRFELDGEVLDLPAF